MKMLEKIFQKGRVYRRVRTAWIIRASNWTIDTLRRVIAARDEEYHEELFERDNQK
jgi:hypothetical protein